MIPQSLQPVIDGILKKGIPLFAVGGVVRDYLRGKKTRDIDIVTDRNPIDFIGEHFDYNPRYQIVTLNSGGFNLEIARMRRDFAYTGRHSGIEFVSNIEEDLPRRDFTVNAIAYDLRKGQYIDPFGGRKDVSDGILRTVGEPMERFREDYFRILRLARFALKLDFQIDRSTIEAARALSHGVEELNPGLLKPEINKIIRKYPPQSVLSIFDGLNLMKPLFGIGKICIPTVAEGDRDLLYFAVILGVYGDNPDVLNRLVALQFPKTLIGKAEYVLSAIRFFQGGDIPPKLETYRDEMIQWAEKVGVDMNAVHRLYPGLYSEPVIKSRELKSLITEKGISLRKLQEIRGILTLNRLKGFIKTRTDAENMLDELCSKS